MIDISYNIWDLEFQEIYFFQEVETNLMDDFLSFWYHMFPTFIIYKLYVFIYNKLNGRQ